MSTISKVAQNTSLYLLSNLILRASSIIFFPIFSFYLTREDYGILFVTQSITAVIVSFSALEIQKSITRFIHDSSIKSGPEVILASGIKISLASNLFFTLIFLFAGSFLFLPLLNDIEFYPYAFVAVLGVAFSSLVDNYRAYLKAMHLGTKSFWFDLYYYGCNILLNLVFVVLFKMNVLGIILSTLVSGIAFCLYIGIKFRKFMFAGIEMKLVRAMLSFSLPLIPFTLIGLLLTTADRFMLNNYVGTEASGIYYIAFTMAALFSAVKEAMYASFTPWFFQHFKKENYGLIVRLINLLLIAAGLIAISISSFAFEILKVISSKEDFVIAWQYVPFFTWGFLVVFAGQLLSLPIFHSKRTNFFFLSNLSGFVVLVLAGWFMIRDYHIYGILSARILAFMVMTVVQVLMAWHLSDFRTNLWHMMAILGLTFVLSFIHYLPMEYYSLLALKLALVLTSGILFLRYVKRTYYREEAYAAIFRKLIA